MMTFFFWLFVWFATGIITIAILIYKDYKDGKNVTLQDFMVALGASALGPILPLILFMTKVSEWFRDADKIVIVKGKKNDIP